MTRKGYLLHTYLLLYFLVLQIDSRYIPLISSRVKRALTNREKVKEIQLQNMLRSMDEQEKQEQALLSIFRAETLNKRDVDSTPAENKHLNKLFGEHIPWDIVRRQVPFDALIKRNNKPNIITKTPNDINKLQNDINNLQNDINKRQNIEPNKLPCKRKRSVQEQPLSNGHLHPKEGIALEKRDLNSQPGNGIVPGYSMYDELCEDAQPVEVVKIDRLVVENGIIKDQNIIEKAMMMK